MFEWLLKIMGNFGSILVTSANNMNETATTIASAEYATSLPIIQYLGAIHYVAGDFIWYECMSMLMLGVTVTLCKLILGILRLIRDIKQTALF